MINYLFASFFIIGILYSFFTNTNISNEMLLASSASIKLIFSILPVMCLWLGIMNVAKKSGLLDTIAKYITPILKIIFPEFFLKLIYNTSYGVTYLRVVAPFFLIYYVQAPLASVLQSINLSKYIYENNLTLEEFYLMLFLLGHIWLFNIYLFKYINSYNSSL